MIVVLDTTETFHDLTLQGANFILLKGFLARTSSELIVPQIVVEETKNHFKEQLESHVAKVESAFQGLNKILVAPVAPVALNPVQATEKYVETLADNLTSLGAKQPDYQAVSLQGLVDRALSRRKPFDSHGRAGFRDAVLWATILTIVSPGGEKIILISKNTKDFGTHGELAHDLQDDLTELGVPADAVTVCDGMPTFVREFVTPELERLDSIYNQLSGGERYGTFDAEEFYTDNETLILEELHSGWWELFGKHNRSRSTPELRWCDVSLESIDIADVWGVNSDEIAIGVTYKIETDIPYDGNEDYEYLWDDYYCEDGTRRIGFDIYMTVIVRRGSGDPTEWEVNDVGIDFLR